MTKISFVLAGRHYELDSDDVRLRLSGVEPESIYEHAVRVGDRWYPVRQAFEMGSGLPRSAFTSHAARRYLGALGFELRGEVSRRDVTAGGGQPTRAELAPVALARELPGVADAWPSEAAVQARVVTALVANHWRILSVANTATKERGIDVVAARDDRSVGIEVKGYPSKDYADPRRAGEVKKTQPSTQAGHWYAQAVLAAMRLRSKQPTWASVIALPEFRRYRDLYAETEDSLAAVGIEVWWVQSNGNVSSSAADLPNT